MLAHYEISFEAVTVIAKWDGAAQVHAPLIVVEREAMYQYSWSSSSCSVSFREVEAHSIVIKLKQAVRLTLD